MKRLFSSVALICSVMLSGCALSAWEAEEYVVKNGPPREFRGEDFGGYPSFTINGVVFKAYLKGAVEGIHEGKGPFRLHVSAWKKSAYEVTVRIVDISAKDSKGSGYILIQKDHLPLSATFKELKFSGTTHTCEWATWQAMGSISASPKKGESVTVFIEFEVMHEGKSTRRILVYNFLPRIRSGSFKWPTV